MAHSTVFLWLAALVLTGCSTASTDASDALAQDAETPSPQASGSGQTQNDDASGGEGAEPPADPAEGEYSQQGGDVVVEPAEQSPADQSPQPREEPQLEDLDIPEEWLSDSARAWPASAGFESGVPVLSRSKDCLLADQLPEMFGSTAEITDAGFGPWGPDPQAEDAYRHVCNLWSPDEYAGRLVLIQADSEATAQNTLEHFREQPSSEAQQNQVEELEYAGQQFHVLSRWYLAPNHGRYEVLHYDEEANAFAVLELTYLSEELWEAGSPQEMAGYLVDILTAGTAEPAPVDSGE
ncbi:hypothetical protein GCM10009771_25210 [Nesterenkonia flava]